MLTVSTAQRRAPATVTSLAAGRLLVGEGKNFFIHSFSIQTLLAHVRCKTLTLLEELNIGVEKKGNVEVRGTQKSQRSSKLVVRKPEF